MVSSGKCSVSGVEGGEFVLKSCELLCTGVKLLSELGERSLVLLLLVLVVELLRGELALHVLLSAVQLLLRALQLTLKLLQLQLMCLIPEHESEASCEWMRCRRAIAVAAGVFG